MRAANSAREGATVSKVTGVSTYGAYTARMASASPRAAIRTFALVAQGEKSIGSILSCRKGRRCARSGQNRVPILPRACNRRPRPRLARSRLPIEPASSVLRRRMAAPCSPVGPAGTISLIYMLQNRGFGTLGALHRKRFGQNPRSRFSRGDETIVARGGRLPKTRFCSIEVSSVLSNGHDWVPGGSPCYPSFAKCNIYLTLC